MRNGWDDVAEPPLFTGFQVLHQTSSPRSSTTDLREIGGFLLSEDILKAGNYDHPLQKYRKREYIKPLYSLSTHAQSSMNPRHCEM